MPSIMCIFRCMYMYFTEHGSLTQRQAGCLVYAFHLISIRIRKSVSQTGLNKEWVVEGINTSVI